jgi:integrase
MNVQEAIDQLKKLNPDAKVKGRLMVASERIGAPRRPPPKFKMPPESYNDSQMFEILRACRYNLIGWRERVGIILMWRCCLRVNEMRQLRPEDINFEDAYIMVKHGKGSQYSGPHDRIVGMDLWTRDYVWRWYDNLFNRLRVPARSSLLPRLPMSGVYGPSEPRRAAGQIKWFQPMSRKAWWNLTKRISDKLGYRVHCHGFRHSGAMTLVTAEVPLETIAQQMGHVNMSTTQRYIEHRLPFKRLQAVRGLKPEWVKETEKLSGGLDELTAEVFRKHRA